MTVERIKIDAKRKNEKEKKKKKIAPEMQEKKNFRKCQQIGTKPPNLLTSV